MSENTLATTNETAPVEVIDASSMVTSEVANLILTNLDKLENSKGAVKLGADYYEFKAEGESVKGVFAGYVRAKFKVDNFDPKNPQYDEQDAVKWVMKGKDKKIETKICSSVALVNRCKENNIQIGAGVEFTFTGVDPVSKRVKLFDVAVIAL